MDGRQVPLHDRDREPSPDGPRCPARGLPECGEDLSVERAFLALVMPVRGIADRRGDRRRP